MKLFDNKRVTGSAYLLLALLVVAGVVLLYQAQPAAGQQPDERLEQLDLTGNGLINTSDAWDVIGAWNVLQERGDCTNQHVAAANTDNNQCITVADVQRVLAHWGEPADPDVSVSDAGVETLATTTNTFVVTESWDGSDNNPGDGICDASSDRGNQCTLRAAVEEANRSSGADVIEFDIGSCPATEPITIDLYKEIKIEDDRTTIDGYTQCGASENTQEVGSDAVIIIELKGNGKRVDDGGYHGIEIKTGNNVIRGLAVYNFDRQIEIVWSPASHNVIAGNYIGTNAANTFTADSLDTHHSEGIRIMGGQPDDTQNGPSYNRIGGSEPKDRNVISGNGSDGVHLQHAAYENKIIGNYVGLKKDGVNPLRNFSDGVDFEEGPQNNWLGGCASGERNVIGGNYSEGIEISHNTLTKENHVACNYFGISADAQRERHNSTNGVSVEDTANTNYIYGNVIGGNSANGVRFYVLADNNEVYDNWIGVLPDGTSMPNGTDPTTDKGRSGVYGTGGSQGNVIHDNVIAYNPEYGINLDMWSDDDNDGFGETYYNTISENSIFANELDGIQLHCSTSPHDGKTYCANQGLPAPDIDEATTSQVTGTACDGCVVEVFITDDSSDSAGEGKTFIGSDVATNGTFAVSVSGVSDGEEVTATATDSAGNTSEFSANVTVVAGTSPTATPTKTTEPASPTPTATTPAPTATHTPTPTATATSGTPDGNVRVLLPLIFK